MVRLHALFNQLPNVSAWIVPRLVWIGAGIGCVDCKKMLLESLVPALEKHRAARAELDRNPGRIDELVQLGTKKATAVAEQTMARVRDAVKLT